MPKLLLPKRFINECEYQDIQDGRLVKKTRIVESDTAPISVDFSGIGPESYTAEALKTKRKLELNPGECKEFSQEEARFLTGLYPFIREAVESSEVPVPTPASIPAPAQVPTLGEIPTNFMRLKAYVAAKGIPVTPTDRKEDLMRKLAEAK